MEEKAMPKSKTVLRRIFRKRSSKILIISGICLVLLMLLMPFTAKIYLQKWLLKNGADVAVIQKIRFNPFTGSAAMKGVNIEQNGKVVFSDTVIFLDVGLKSLLNREALLEQVTLTDILIDIERKKDGSVRVAFYDIISQGHTISSEPKEEGLPWIFRARNIELQNVTVHYQQPDFNTTLDIEEALIKGINTDPDDKTTGTLRLKGTVNGAHVDLDLAKFVVTPEINIQGNIGVRDFRLDDLAGLLSEYIKPFSGVATLDGNVNFGLAENDDLHVLYDGLVHLKEGDIAGDGWATKGTINYNGKAAFSMNEQEMVVDVDGDLQALDAAFDMPDPVIDIDNADISINGKTIVTIAEEVIVDTSASLKLAPTTFGMDILKTSTGNLSWDGKVRVETGTENKELAVRVDGALNVADPAYSMNIGDALMEVNNESLSWNGSVEYIMGMNEDSTSFVRTDGTLISKSNIFSLPEVIQIQQKDLDFYGKTEVAIGTDIGVSYQGDITLDGTKVSMKSITIGDKQVTWSGEARYEMGEDEQSISLDGIVKGNAVYADVDDMHISQQSITTEADCTLSLSESPAFKGTLSLNGDSTEIKTDDVLMLSLSGVSVANVKDNGSGGIVVESIQLRQLAHPASKERPVTVTVPQLSISDIQSPDLLSGSIGKVSIQEPLVIDPKGELQLAALDNIDINSVKVTKDMLVTVEEITAGNGIFLKEKNKKALATLAKVHAGQLKFSSEKGLVCNTVDLDGLYANITKQKSEEKKEEERSDTETSTTEKSASTIPVQIKQIKVTGKSGFMFTDTSLAQTFKTVFSIKSLQADDINLNKPEQAFSYMLDGAFDKYSAFSAEGKCAPLAANIFWEQKVFLQNYSLLYASPYTIQAIGTFFPDGILDYTSQLKIAEGRIDMDNNLVFTGLEAETVADELASELNNSLPIPLDLALSMLRDSDGNINIKVPIDGKLSELHIGVTDIIVTALAKGITLAVTPYLAYTALGPAGALAFAGAKVGQALLETGLPVLEFEPGAQELTEAQTKILSQVAEKIKADDTKDVRYSICAKVSWDDLSTLEGREKNAKHVLQDEAVRRELFKVGEHRSLLVQEYLFSHFGISKDSIPVCNPGFEFEESQKAKIFFKRSAQE